MKKTKTQLILLLCIFLSSCQPKTDSWVKTRNINGEDWQCISTYERFLYQMTKIDRHSELYSLPDIEPQEPWRYVGEISMPASNDPWLRLNEAHIEMTRSINGHTELWIHYGNQFIKYIPDTENYVIVPGSPSDEAGKIYEDVKVNNIFETATGKIMGINYPVDFYTEWNQEYLLFSIYNENEEAFTFYDMGLAYTSEEIKFDYEGMTPRYGVIISHVDDQVWIYQQEEGLYRYDPDASTLQHFKTNFDGVVRTVLATHENFLWIGQEINGQWLLTPGEVLKYYPETQTTEEIHVPFFRWPDYGNWIYTSSGDLWIGIHGDYSHDEKWNLKNPDRFAYTNLGMDSDTYNWQQPNLIYQSSNGYLWYKNDKYDFLGVNGAAWMDPETNKGCWFTNQPASIIEDQNQTLWMLIGDQVYTYAMGY